MLELKTNDVYGQNFIGPVKIEAHMSTNKGTKDTCVLGVLATDRGARIMDEMLVWLLPSYNVYVVIQEPPGKLFEWPAIRLCQYLLTNGFCDNVLYLHTKGASHDNPYQSMVRRMWKEEFIDHKDEYMKLAESGEYDVLCPFTGYNKNTWFNGMLIKKTAFSYFPELKPQKSRFVFEIMFRNTPAIVHGRIMNDISNSVDSSVYKDTLKFGDYTCPEGPPGNSVGRMLIYISKNYK